MSGSISQGVCIYQSGCLGLPVRVSRIISQGLWIYQLVPGFISQGLWIYQSGCLGLSVSQGVWTDQSGCLDLSFRVSGYISEGVRILKGNTLALSFRLPFLVARLGDSMAAVIGGYSLHL